MSKLSFQERLQLTKSPLLKKLFNIMVEKKTNLCVSADFDTIEETLEFAEKFGEHFAVLKVHTDFFGSHSVESNLSKLYQLKKKHNFLLFEDRKFVDIANTTKLQYKNYVRYADLVTVVSVFGPEIFDAIQEVVDQANLPNDEPRGCLAVCEPSTPNPQMCSPEEMLQTARNSNICVGIIAQKLQIHDPSSMIKATPGVHVSKTDQINDNQRYKHPSVVIGNGADLVIVGRGIIAGLREEMEERVLLYKDVCWRAYCDSL